ncbi:glycosyltransferase [Solimonas soli]|uniref:glycosyltransferase n=1 Tax=Solimonas soli TaxID=413479 RepID=UPI0009FC1697|nr:glycosyltransferase [Solimonas soli]
MRVTHVNVRLAEGGAAQVGLDLHRRLMQAGDKSEFFYGYGPGAGRSPEEAHIPGARQLGSKIGAMTNFIAHRIAGVEVLPPYGDRAVSFEAAIKHSDVIHLHATHSYYLPLGWLSKQLRVSQKPIVWTAHDFWLLTGRCAFIENCMRWTVGCGKCPTQKNYPPAMIDVSASMRRYKQKTLAPLIPMMTIVAPTPFVADMFKTVFPTEQVKVISNGLDFDFEQSVRRINWETNKQRDNTRVHIIVIAKDLSDPTKTDHELINKLLGGGNVILHTVGQNSPFFNPNVINHGTLTDRQTLAEILFSCDYLIFSSKKDTFGLVMAEAMACGVTVLAVDSPAARAVLGGVDSHPLADLNSFLERVKSRPSIFNRKMLSEKALRRFSGGVMMTMYKQAYGEAIGRGRA